MTCENCRFWESEHKYMFCRNPKSIYFLQRRDLTHTCSKHEMVDGCWNCKHCDDLKDERYVCTNVRSARNNENVAEDEWCRWWEEKNDTDD